MVPYIVDPYCIYQFKDHIVDYMRLIIIRRNSDVIRLFLYLINIYTCSSLSSGEILLWSDDSYLRCMIYDRYAIWGSEQRPATSELLSLALRVQATVTTSDRLTCAM